MENKSNNIEHIKIDYDKLLNKDVFRYLPVKLVPALIGLANIIILTHNLNPDKYGNYSIVITITLLMVQLTGTWLSNAVLYVYPDYTDRKKKFQAEALKAQLFIAIPASITAFFLLLVATKQVLLAAVGTAILLFQLLQSLLLTFLQSTRQIIEQTISVSMQSITQITVLCILIFWANGNETSALLAVLCGYAVGTFFLLFRRKINHSNYATPNVWPDKTLLKQLFNYGIPMCVWFFATQFYSIGDRILLNSIRSSADVGQYASFRDLSVGCAGFLTMPLLMASHPLIMQMWKSGLARVDIEKLLTRNIILLTLFFIPVLVLIDLAGSDLLAMLLGVNYLLDKNIMLLVILSIFCACISMYVMKGLEVTGQTFILAKISVIVALFSLIGNILLIRWLGITGAALIALASQLLYLMAVHILTRKILSVKIPFSFLKKMAIWTLGVELICRLLVSAPGFIGELMTSTYSRLIIVVMATGGLYVTSGEVRAIAYLVYQFFVTSTRSRNVNCHS